MLGLLIFAFLLMLFLLKIMLVFFVIKLAIIVGFVALVFWGLSRLLPPEIFSIVFGLSLLCAGILGLMAVL